MQRSDLSTSIERIAECLERSPRVLIGAGAGLSVAAGLDYTDEESFARHYPGLRRRGFRACYELIGRHDLPAPVFWGYSHSDDAGTIDLVGEGVSAARIGERVWCYGAQSYRPFGTAAEYTSVPTAQAVPFLRTFRSSRAPASAFPPLPRIGVCTLQVPSKDGPC